ncbi:MULTISPECIES: rod shape-determining protein RodA [unclassified Acidovorax]|jgi:rod shape determining protein RodA|uniref:rod shape-determining protein RodA n=1 Tax=unclassified Acidovorax TaxID=2684926 RepID=UPI000BD20DCA|nr:MULTISPECIES: rod shape-determining protein RodA [unclassified Acidovorax]OZA57302.1 MAG: rod shape-determining protein RodA [Acidovorax sp. 17-64-282]HQS21019.1 rod shape-determining protein RodA [Acidovorax defluvii]MBP8832814.1 rod shape-determining protein RodA [Acidovorax sp.]MBP9641627.1 rod shape-determining protein RodA [Acidovorax sp.]OYY27460.1 MAG: rod shape-determining protein RodA [Acidovorax sp. 35-64-16]
MAAVFDKPSIAQRFVPLFQGFDWPLVLVVAVLASAGLLAMYSSGYDHGSRFADHARNMLIAGSILFVVAQVPPQKLMVFAVPLYAAGVALLVAVALFGITKKGAQRWINLGIVIQPSEILKIAMPLMLAWWFQKREGQLRPLDFAAAGLLLAIPVGLIMKQPDLGTSLLVLAAGLSVIFFAGLSWKLVLPPVLLGAVGILLLVSLEPQLCAEGVRWSILHDYQQQRICTLLDPSRDPLGKGFHIIQGMIAIGSGGIFGKGFMAGTQTHLEFIPERTTDFIFAAFSEEFGLAGNLFLIVCFLLLVWRGLAIAVGATTLFGRLMAGAVSMIFFTYAFVNMGMVSGILPVVGVPLPFISYGGTAMVTLGLALGILMSVARAQHLDPKDARPAL